MTMKSTLNIAACMAAFALLSACATSPSDTMNTTSQTAAVATDAPSSTKMADADPNDKVCKRQTVVGSNFKKKICMTQAQWDQAAEYARNTTGDIQRSAGPGASN